MQSDLSDNPEPAAAPDAWISSGDAMTTQCTPFCDVIRGSEMRVYIAGKMSGLPEMGYPAFHTEAARLRAIGYAVENPAENPEQDSWLAYLRVSIRQMLTCDAVALLPNWKQSRGALIEHGIAIALGIPARPCEEFQGELDVITRSNYIMRTTKGVPA